MKVKNIMFSGFAAAILMGVAVEANAAPTAKIVASKGYVDTITGKLDGLPTANKNSLVAAMVELDDTKQDAFQDGTDATTTTGFISSVVQTNGKVDAEATEFDTVVDAGTSGHTNTAPTTKAVYDAIQNVADQTSDLNLGQTGGDGKYVKWVKQDNGLVTAQEGTIDTEMLRESTNPVTNAAITAALNGKQDAFGDGTDATTTTGFISSVVQTNGKVDAEATEFDTVVDAGTSGHTNTAPTTKAVYDAIQNVADQTSDLNLDQVGADGQYVKLVSQSDGQVAATAQGFDTTVSSTSTDANAPTSKAVYTAIQGVAAQIPAMPDACQGADTVCVLTSEEGNVYWSVLAKPYSNVVEGNATEIENGITAQQQLISTTGLPEAVNGGVEL